jgi:hypothetical protein
MLYPYVMTDKSCTVLIDGTPYQIDRKNASWDRLKEALADPSSTAEDLINLLSPLQSVTAAVAGTDVEIRNGTLYVDGEPVHSALAARIVDIAAEGMDVDPWIKFVRNLWSNPFTSARNELYDFLERAELPITPDGCFIAYKKVRDDYKDVFSGSIENRPGNYVVMPGGREAVDPIRTNLCSTGLHFCSKGYLDSFGGSRIVLVKINPADVVSIPTDYDFSKGRTWRYEVVGEIPVEEARVHEWAPIDSGYGDHEWGYAEKPYDYLADDEDYEHDVDFSDPDDDEEDDVVAVTWDDTVTAMQEAVNNASRVVIETVAHGTITVDRFFDLLKEHGTMAGIARNLGLSTGTVQQWKTKLFQNG